MARMHYALRNLENIHRIDSAGDEFFGCDQNWFRTEWQQMAGCAPSTAATLLLYLKESGRIHLPMDVIGKDDCLLLMEAVWHHITPTANGIYLIEQFCGGIESFARSHGLSLDCRALSIPASGQPRPTRAEAVDFIIEGLAHDTPIAFLNLCNGDVADLEEWHWVTLVSLDLDPDRNEALASLFDGNMSVCFNFGRWYETTIDGGALVYLTAADQKQPVSAASRTADQ